VPKASLKVAGLHSTGGRRRRDSLGQVLMGRLVSLRVRHRALEGHAYQQHEHDQDAKR
jgi:hypothetical protein